MEIKLNTADRLTAISEEIMGMAKLLLIMYDNEFRQGCPALHLLVLSKTAERYGCDLKMIAEAVQNENEWLQTKN